MRLPPILRFMMIAALIFLGQRVLTEAAPAAPVPLVLTQATQSLLFGEEEERLGRSLNDQEREHVLLRWEDETLLVEDARRLGLEVNDPIIRRRLEEKMRYLLEDAASSAATSDDALSEHLTRYPERFMLPAKFKIEQRFFSRALRGAALDADAQAALQTLAKGDSVLGDPHPAGTLLAPLTSSALRERLGRVISARLSDLPKGTWSGPYASQKGLHLVRLLERIEPSVATLKEARALIEASWRIERREQELRRELDALRERRGIRPEARQ